MSKKLILPDEVVISKIYYLRKQKVMLDRDLATLYQVKTSVLKQAVRRNINRFPKDFMFEMTKEELENWDFMVQYLSNLTGFGNLLGLAALSKEAKLVFDEGKKLWQAYFSNTDVRSVRDELKLNRADVGWYQIRKALQARNASGDFAPVSFKPFEEAYKTLSEKLQPQVYELGFLRV